VVAALIYRRQAHLINLFIWPASAAGPTTASRDGYNMENWSEDGLTFWAVSDVSAGEVEKFRETFSEHIAR
jgi:anti-sigma factor RsiW